MQAFTLLSDLPSEEVLVKSDFLCFTRFEVRDWHHCKFWHLLLGINETWARVGTQNKSM